MPLPTLTPADGHGLATDSVVLVVYAPFGHDDVLSTYPEGTSTELTEHPLYSALVDVAEQGAHVVALIDRVQHDTVLVQIRGGKPASAVTVSRWKQDMTSPHTLGGLLALAHQLHPEAAVVLAVEGHGAGYLPELDRRHITQSSVTTQVTTSEGVQQVGWLLNADSGSPVLPSGSPILPSGSPILPSGSPILPSGSPILPASHMPLSTWGMGHALKLAEDAGGPKLSVIHFNNCFNMSVELLHTVAPFAEFATGYANYNFFTSGESYPQIFKRLRLHGPVKAGELAQWFAQANHKMLEAKGNHPTMGSVVDLSGMKALAELVDDLADAMLAELRAAAGSARINLVGAIATAIKAAQQFDTAGTDFELETPDSLTDLMSFAAALQDLPAATFKLGTVVPAAKALQSALMGVKQYGDNERPWLVPDKSGIAWDFSSPNLAMNIFLPDPDLSGQWDWRSPFYLAVDAESDRPLVQPHVIDFLKVTDWVDFIKELHRDVPFVGLLSAVIPTFPAFNATYEPKREYKVPSCHPPYKPKAR
jgi:Clostripain family